MLRIAYDLRGIYPSDINKELAYRVAYAFGQGRDTVVVGRDCRHGSEELYNAVLQGLQDAGVMVYALGLVPTPVLSFAVRATQASGGIMITASHNPPQYNGMKFFDERGTSLPREDIRAVFEMSTRIEFHETPDGCIVPVDVREKYVAALPDAKEITVVVDFGNGAGIWYKPILEEFFNVVPLNDSPDPDFGGRGPEPTVEQANAIANTVESEGANFALLLDGDADRSVFADTAGFLNPSLLFVLFGRWFLQEQRGNVFVASIDISPRVMQYLPGARIIRTKIGTAFIVRAARENGAVFSGEYSCHFTAYDFSGHSDPLFFTNVLSNFDLAKEKKEIRLYPLVSASYRVDEPNRYIEAAATLGTVLSRIDGVEFMYKDHRVLVRPSNTEPKIRIYVEGPRAERIVEDVARRLNLIS